MKLRIVSFVLLSIIVLNTAFIFFNSSLNAEKSGSLSKQVARAVAPYLIINYNGKTAEEQSVSVKRLESVIRGVAHGVEFFPLGLCSSLIVLSYGYAGKKRLLLLLLCFIGCLLCAVCDEVRQLYSPGRAFQFTDICVDTLGSTAGILTSCLFYCILNRKKHRNAA